MNAAGEVGLAVVPANLAVGHEVNAGVDLFLDDLFGDLVGDAGHFFKGGVTAIQTVLGGPEIGGLSANLWVVANGGGEQEALLRRGSGALNDFVSAPISYRNVAATDKPGWGGQGVLQC